MPGAEVPKAPDTARPTTETSNPNADAAKKAAKDNGSRWKKMNPLRLLKAFATKKEPAPATQGEAPQAQVQPQADRNPPVAAVLQGERAQAEARGAANPDQEALMGMASSGIDAADLGPDGQVRSSQTETPVSSQPPVVESVGVEQPLGEVLATTPTNNEPIDIATARTQRRPDATVATNTGPVSADTTPSVTNPETSAQPDAETAARQQEAYNKIGGPDGLGYVVNADTNPSVLLAKLVKNNGWQPDRATADYVRGAVDLAKSRLDPEAAAAVSARVAPALPDVQREAFNKIDPLYKIEADTDPAVLLANLVKNDGWEANAETAAYVQAAVDHVSPAAEEVPAASTGEIEGAETPAEGTIPANVTPEEPAEAATGPKTEIQLLREALAARDAKIDKLEESMTKLTEYLLEKEKDEKKKKTLIDIIKAIGKGSAMGAAGLASDIATAAQAEAIGQQAA